MKNTTVTKSESPRAAYLAANPQARALQESHLSEITRRLSEVLDSWKPMMQTFRVNAENARQVGILLLDFEDTLPGKRITPDFYEQLKDQFRTADGSLLTYEWIQWLIHMAREFPEGIKSDAELAAVWKQMPRVFQSEFGFHLEAEPQMRHLPAAPTTQLKELFKPDIAEVIERLRADANLCPDGNLRPDIKAALKIEMPAKLKPWDEAREWLRGQIGI